MSGTALLWTIILVVAFLALVALSVWIRRLDADDYLEGSGGMTDDERRAAQLGIGLAGTGTMGGH